MQVRAIFRGRVSASRQHRPRSCRRLLTVRVPARGHGDGWPVTWSLLVGVALATSDGFGVERGRRIFRAVPVGGVQTHPMADMQAFRDAVSRWAAGGPGE